MESKLKYKKPDHDPVQDFNDTKGLIFYEWFSLQNIYSQ